MFVFQTISALRAHLSHFPKNKTIGFVPTMGALHAGHLQLVREAQKACDLVVVSIFVNPLQFNNPHDFEKYPNTLEKDTKMLEELGCDLLFAPNAKEMYPSKTTLKFDFGPLETVMEGKFRPGHFNGVAVVVSKLFHIVAPHTVFFGQKDFQQCAVIKTLITDLSFPIEMVTVPTMREESGLAMSSRNQRLSQEGLQKASYIYKGLIQGKQALKQGLTIVEAKALMEKLILEADIVTEYIEIVDEHTLLTPSENSKRLVICFAGFLEDVRLIDNIIVEYNNG